MWTGQNHRTKMDDLWWLKILKMTNFVAPFVTHTRISVVRFRLSPQRQGRSKYQFGPGWCPQALKTIQPSSHCKHQHFSRSALGCNKYACIYASECIFTYIYIIYNDNMVKRPKLWQRNRYQNISKLCMQHVFLQHMSVQCSSSLWLPFNSAFKIRIMTKATFKQSEGKTVAPPSPSHGWHSGLIPPLNSTSSLMMSVVFVACRFDLIRNSTQDGSGKGSW